MELSLITTIVLPIAIVLMMLGIGLGLNLNAFKQVLRSPLALVCGLIAQLVMLPVVGFGVAALFPLAPELAVGVVIVVACPGGATSNMLTYLVKGNLALSVTLTVLSTLVTVVTIPFVVNFGMRQFMSEAVVLQLPILKTMIQLAALKILPLIVGMVIKGYWPKWAAKAEQWAIKTAFVGLVVVVLSIVVQTWDDIPGFFGQVGLAMLTLNVTTMLLGYAIALLIKLDHPSAKAITAEVGIQGVGLAIAIASTPTMLNQPIMSVPAVVYGLLMYATGGVFVWVMSPQPRLLKI
jgi:BASS family bile acid:Na+ symporter